MNKKVFAAFLPVFLLTFIFSLAQESSINISAGSPGTVWPIEKANEWHKANNWVIGANFIPSTAINQLEMWQKETFDTATINRELGWAESIGFNTMRVFLHSIAWKGDPEGFKERMGQYLAIADRHKIK